VKNGVGEITDKLPRILLLKPQHDIVPLLSPEFFNVVVAAGEIDLKAGTDERPVDRGIRVYRVAA
jgi:hypothetical protein